MISGPNALCSFTNQFEVDVKYEFLTPDESMSGETHSQFEPRGPDWIDILIVGTPAPVARAASLITIVRATVATRSIQAGCSYS